MKRRERIKTILLLGMVLVLLAGGCISFRSVRSVEKPAYEQMCAAARQMESCMGELKAERLRRGLPIDESEDRFATGLLGTGHTAITTTLGNLEAKRTACQPDMAALVVDMLTEAGVKAGDRVGLCCTGSFPLLNLASVCAAEAIGAEPVIIVSVGASSYGANLPAFTAPEMLLHLYEKGLVATAPAAVTLGGDGDVGKNMGALFFPEEEEPILNETVARLRSLTTVTEIPDRAQNLAWREEVYGDISCFISVGGHALAMIGEGEASGHGILKAKGTLSDNSLIGYYLNRQVPVIQLLNVKGLCADYGLVFDPMELPPIGTSAVYFRRQYPRLPLALSALGAGGILAAIWLQAKRDRKSSSQEASC